MIKNRSGGEGRTHHHLDAEYLLFSRCDKSKCYLFNLYNVKAQNDTFRMDTGQTRFKIAYMFPIFMLQDAPLSYDGRFEYNVLRTF